MTDKNFTVMVAGIVQAGMEEYVKGYLEKMVERAQQEEGCIVFHIHQSLDNANEFMMYSVWVDQAAFEVHNATPEMEEFRGHLAKAMFEVRSPKTYWQLIG